MSWTIDPLEANQRLDARYPGSGAGQLAAWAGWTIEGMDYLAGIDSQRPATYLGQEEQRAVDLSHARWATVDAVTAIDLCAAALGRMHCGYPNHKGRELDFGQADGNATLLALPDCRAWLAGVQVDREYADVKELRDALVHRTARRRIDVEINPVTATTAVRGISRIVGGGQGGSRISRVRLHLSNPDDAIPVEQLVPRCRDLAHRHVEAFLSSVDRL